MSLRAPHTPPATTIQHQSAGFRAKVPNAPKEKIKKMIIKKRTLPLT
jgi:hypothetical protein